MRLARRVKASGIALLDAKSRPPPQTASSSFPPQLRAGEREDRTRRTPSRPARRASHWSIGSRHGSTTLCVSRPPSTGTTSAELIRMETTVRVPTPVYRHGPWSGAILGRWQIHCASCSCRDLVVILATVILVVVILQIARAVAPARRLMLDTRQRRLRVGFDDSQSGRRETTK